MKVYLMYPDRDFNLKKELPPHAMDLVKDLGFDVIVRHMSRGDEFLRNVAMNVLFYPEKDTSVIRYRQEIVKDCLEHPDVVRRLYQIPISIKESKRKRWWGVFGWKTPNNVLNGARNALEAMLGGLKELRRIADENLEKFRSRGFKRFFEMLQEELDDEYLSKMGEHLENLKFQKGVLLSVRLGKGNEGEDHTLSKPRGKNWFQRIFEREKVFSYKLHPRDEIGSKVLESIVNLGLKDIATNVAIAADHVESFFNTLQLELAFYVACLNLVESLRTIGISFSFPEVFPTNEERIVFRNLKDIALALSQGTNVVGNELEAERKRLFVIMGANRGGKTTFLRSVGQAQIMAQAGMFVAAESASISVRDGVFTHFRRKEDANLKRGKFEEELERVSKMLDHVSASSLILFNESFSSTNEYEGSEVAHQIVKALIDSGVRVFYVTHMFDLARRFLDDEKVVFLVAERKENGERTFKVKEGKPTETSFGLDLYREIFEEKEEVFPS